MAVLTALALGGCGGSTNGGGASFNLTEANDRQVTRLVATELGARTEEGDRRRVRDAVCTPRECTISYEADAPVLDTRDTLLEEQRPIWRQLFSDPDLRNAVLITYGQTVSVGGKESVSAALRVRCDRAAHREIDWRNIDAEGIRRLCGVRELVSFD